MIVCDYDKISQWIQLYVYTHPIVVVIVYMVNVY